MKRDYTNYVAGFLFGTPDQVVLVKKNLPEGHGRLDAVGGKIEPGELIREAMVREFREETGVQFDDWKYYCMLDGADEWHSYYWRVHFFFGACPKAYAAARSTTDERVVHKSLKNGVGDLCLPNLKWLIPLAQTIMSGAERSTSFYVKENAGKFA